MLSPEEKRKVISDYYPSEGWKARVKKMSTQQVNAIFMRMLEEGKLKGIV